MNTEQRHMNRLGHITKEHIAAMHINLILIA